MGYIGNLGKNRVKTERKNNNENKEWEYSINEKQIRIKKNEKRQTNEKQNNKEKERTKKKLKQ